MSLHDDDPNGPSLELPRADCPDTLMDAWPELLGTLLGETQGRCDKELRLLAAESRTTIAETRAKIAEMHTEFDRRLAEKLASLRDGRDGIPGPRGEPGPAGKPGPPGSPSQLSAVRAWKAGISYEGAIVRHNGATWQCRRDTAAAPSDDCDDWCCVAAAGKHAKPWRVRGTWNPDAVYEAGDVVVTDCNSFVATCDAPSHCPGPGWQLLTAAKRGHRGELGPRGERGLPGVPAPTIVSWDVDPPNYVAVPILSDGSRGAPLGLRVLFEQYQRDTG
jgi:hypothetical protein